MLLPVRPSEHVVAIQTAALRLLAVAAVYGLRVAVRLRNLRG